jgi:hypothetical protein
MPEACKLILTRPVERGWSTLRDTIRLKKPLLWILLGHAPF